MHEDVYKNNWWRCLPHVILGMVLASQFANNFCRHPSCDGRDNCQAGTGQQQPGPGTGAQHQNHLQNYANNRSKRLCEARTGVCSFGEESLV